MRMQIQKHDSSGRFTLEDSTLPIRMWAKVVKNGIIFNAELSFKSSTYSNVGNIKGHNTQMSNFEIAWNLLTVNCYLLASNKNIEQMQINYSDY